MTSSEENSLARIETLVEANARAIASQEGRIKTIYETVDKLSNKVDELSSNMSYLTEKVEKGRKELRKIIDLGKNRPESDQEEVDSIELETEDGSETIYFGYYDIDLNTRDLKRIYFELMTSKDPNARELGEVFHCLIRRLYYIIVNVSPETLSEETPRYENSYKDIAYSTIESFWEIKEDMDYY